MNKNHLPQNLYSSVRLRPAALWIDAEGCAVPSPERTWRIEGVTEKSVRLFCTTTAHVLELGLDHLREYRSDLTSDPSGRQGFLMLQSWVIVEAGRISIEPIHPVQAGSRQLQWPGRYRAAVARAEAREKKRRSDEQGKAFSQLVLGVGALCAVGAAFDGPKRRQR